MSGVMVDMMAFEKLFGERLPELKAHFDNIDISASMIVMQWFLAVFVSIFPTETVFRIFDVLLVEGRAVLFAVSIGFFRIIQNELLKIDDNEFAIQTIKWKCENMFDHSLLLETAFVEFVSWGSLVKRERHAARELIQTNVEAKVRQSVITTLSKVVPFNVDRVNHLYDQFVQAAKCTVPATQPPSPSTLAAPNPSRSIPTPPLSVRSPSTHVPIIDYRGIDEANFFSFLQTIVPECTPDMSHRTFQAFDFNEDGIIDVREMICCTGLLSLSGSFENRLETCFRSFDMDDNGRIDKSELVQMLSVMLSLTYGMKLPEKTIQHLAQRTLTECSLQEKESFNLAEFTLVANSQPIIRSMLENCLPVQTKSLTLSDMVAIAPSVTFSSDAVVQRYSHSRTSESELSRTSESDQSRSSQDSLSSIGDGRVETQRNEVNEQISGGTDHTSDNESDASDVTASSGSSDYLEEDEVL
eukprot:c9214_g1_i4.p1 GENE.c9214_g1_i4~~c9214_g1_i4.p1  ORF type:complete len:470 (-),score=120.84 c9214_g1_i4:1070-2479(-)